MGKSIYPVSFAENDKEYSYNILRTKEGFSKLIHQLYYFNNSIQNFNLFNGLNEFQMKDYPENIKYIYDYGFRIFMKSDGNKKKYCKSSVFYYHCDDNGEVGRALRIEDVKPFLAEFGIGGAGYKYNYKIDYREWDWPRMTEHQLLERLKWFQTEFLRDDTDYGTEKYFVDQYSFVKNLNTIIDNKSGLVISFIGITPNAEIVRFYYEDIKTIEEINKITEYKVIPIVK